MEKEYIQQTLFGTGTDEQEFTKETITKKVAKARSSKKHKMFITEAVPLALEKLGREFGAYVNHYGNSLVSEVRRISERPYVSDNTIMVTLHRLNKADNWNLVACIDKAKGLYRQL